MNVIEMTAAQLSAAIREGKTTAVEAAEAVLAQIEKEDKNYNCYVTVDRDGALTQARAVQAKIEAGELTGPLAGVPVAVKDNICTEGLRTTCSSKILHNFVPTYTAEAVKNLQKAGAVILGKTNMDLPWAPPRKPRHTGPQRIRGILSMCRAVLPAVQRRRLRQTNVFTPSVPTRVVPSGSRLPTAGWWA